MELRSLIEKYLHPPYPENCRVYNLTGSAAALLLALDEGDFIAVEEDEARAAALRKDINFYRRIFSGGEVLFLPDADGAETSGIRAGAVYFLKEDDSLVTSSANLSSTLWDRDSFEETAFYLRKGLRIERSGFEESLIKLGYSRVPMVTGKGEYSIRGWIADLFPPASENPLRAEFFGDEIEQLKTFDIETQRSKEDINEMLLLPATECKGTRSLFDLIQRRTYYCLYPIRRRDEFPQNTVFLSKYSFEANVADVSDDEGDSLPFMHHIDSGMLSIRGCGILPDERKGIRDLPVNVGRLGRENRVIIVASSPGQSERLKDVFMEKGMIVPVVDMKDLIDFEENISITVGDLSSGIFLEGLLIITEKEMFGERPAFRPIKKSKLSNLLMSLDEITPDDFVVHRDRGIGKFTGVVRQRIDENEMELLQIEYEDGRLYIPVQSIQNLSKYRSEEGVVPKIDRLGGKTWQKKKERARKKVQELAARLLDLYATRKTARGFMYSSDTELHREFDSFFSYEETPDQTKAISDIKTDMESEKPMDRLVCGDVGYGKTEVAMRAAFKAVYDNRQVAVLVPTTILAEQHYRTFRERFSGFPVTIDFISRFKSRKEIESALKGVSGGEIDIIIGTHGLLSKKISFNRLGLLIVDEEHKFGVAQKERIKELSRNIDVLNLTATPIPRTLHMALSGIREISVIETPPEERLAVKSIVTVFGDNLIRDAIARELQRNGQVFFVHNRIHDIYKTARRIQELVPTAAVGVAHGQLAEKELETVMHRFFGGEIDVLVSTAIVGAGLDVPRANTIIIDMADKMGLADLYQLRGRVGRSNLKAYAFFLAPGEALLTEEARKRLQAVQEMSYLGAGFRLALKDLEIRGAGDIFGPDQSGHIHEIGFDLYVEMLEKAVEELKGIEVKEELDPVIELKTSAFIPEEYIEDVTLRLSFYRRIASLKTDEETIGFESELRDRFGSLPMEVMNLLKVMRLKISARKLGVLKLQESKGRILFSFSPETKVQPPHIFELRNSRKGAVKFLPDGFELDLRDAGQGKVFEEVYGVMRELADKAESNMAGSVVV